MSQQLDTLARIGLAGAVSETYRNGAVTGLPMTETPEIARLLAELDAETIKAFGLYRANLHDLMRIDKKINALRSASNIGRPLSIITIVEFAIAILDEPARKSTGRRGISARKIVEILLDLSREIAGEREFILSSIAAAKACDVWTGIEI